MIKISLSLEMSAENETTVGLCKDSHSDYQEMLLGAGNFLFLMVANLMIWVTIQFIRSQPPGRKLVKNPHLIQS